MIVAVPVGSLLPKQKEMLTKKGFIVIECDSPDNIRIIAPEINVNSDNILMAALEALSVKNPTTRQEIFINKLFEKLSQNP